MVQYGSASDSGHLAELEAALANEARQLKYDEAVLAATAKVRYGLKAGDPQAVQIQLAHDEAQRRYNERATNVANLQYEYILTKYAPMNKQTATPSATAGASFAYGNSAGSGSATLQSQAKQKQDENWQKVARGEMGREEAISNFDQWYKLNVESPTSLATLAQSARINDMNQAAAQPPPGWAEQFAGQLNHMSGGKTNYTGAMFTPAQPDPEMQAVYKQATLQALKGVSPLAATLTGSPPPNYPDATEAMAQIPAYIGPATQEATPAQTEAVQAVPTPVQREPRIYDPRKAHGGLVE
jgi:hypothetical protein